MDDRLAQLLHWFETLTPENLVRIRELYAADAHFRDPFNDVHGIAQVEAVFAHMFETLERPAFVVREKIADGSRAFVTWDFTFTLGGRSASIHGGTLLRFDASGRVSEHIDYWDAGAQVYERIPLLGWVLRRLRQRLALPERS